MILIPKFKNIIELGGALQIVHTGPDGNLIEERMYSNIVVTAGKNWIAQRMTAAGIAATGGGEMTHMALGGNASGAGGVGSNPAKPGATDLTATVLPITNAGVPATTVTELGRVTLTGTAGTYSGAVVTYAATFAAGQATGSLVEAGIFNAGSAGQMLCYTVFDVVNKAANDSIAITWTVTIQ
jgi:hypothetical protein